MNRAGQSTQSLNLGLSFPSGALLSDHEGALTVMKTKS